MKDYNYYKIARTIAREGCERTIKTMLYFLERDNSFIHTDLADNDREYLNIDMSEYSRITEGWC